MDKGKSKKSVREDRDLEWGKMLKDVKTVVTTEVLKHNPVLAQRFMTQFRKFLEEATPTEVKAEENLPPELRDRLKNKKAWRKACERRYIWYDGKRWRFSVEKVRLAYICGRCFSNDCRKGGKWKGGDVSFPGTLLEAVFGVDCLIQSRANGLEKKILDWAKDIDSQLFER